MRRNHLKPENLETLFLPAALKVTIKSVTPEDTMYVSPNLSPVYSEIVVTSMKQSPIHLNHIHTQKFM